MAYRRNFGPESIEDLRNNINSCHEDFLKEDDMDKKADFLRYMTAYGMQFLYLVPHDKKFVFKETERVLHHSSMNISDFDPREASVSFEQLAKYAHNVLDQPWRADFRVIKLTSGFFVHNISSQLHNAHEILVAMGYVHTDETTLTLLPNVEIRRLKAVSRDMIVASQECLIMSQIWQRVADQEPEYPLTIGEVFEFRRSYVGDTDTICKTLLSDIRRRNHEAAQLQRLRKNDKKFVPVDKLIDYEGMEAPEHHKMNGRPEREVEIVENVLRNTRLLYEKEEHIYDPVYGANNGHQEHPYPSSNDGNKPHPAFLTSRKSNGQLHYTDSYPKSRDSVSPMIPKTISKFCTNPGIHYGSQTISNSSSMSSLSSKAQAMKYGYPSQSHQPLKFSKVPPEEGIWNQERAERRDSLKKINHQYEYNDQQQINDRTHFDSRDSRQQYDSSEISSRSRRPILANDVYPDDYFPRVVHKPTAIHSSSNTRKIQQIQSHDRYSEDNSEEDVMNEALAYRSEINGLIPSRQPNLISSNKSSTSATTSTTRSSTEEREPPLKSLDTVYYDYLLSKDEQLEQQLHNHDHTVEYTVKREPSDSSPREELEVIRNRKMIGSGLEMKNSTPTPRNTPERNTLDNKNRKSLTGSSAGSSKHIHLNSIPQNDPSSSNLSSSFDSGKKLNEKTIMETGTPNVRIPIENEIPTPPGRKIVPWNCRFCTYKNKEAERICDVCAKSKDFFEEEPSEDEEAPPTIPTPIPPGPKLYSQSVYNSEIKSPKSNEVEQTKKIPCPQCTLLNDSPRLTCDACDFRLKKIDSPFQNT